MSYNTKKIQEEKKKGFQEGLQDNDNNQKKENKVVPKPPAEPDIVSNREKDLEPVEENSDKIREQEPEVDAPIPDNEKTEKKIPEMKK